MPEKILHSQLPAPFIFSQSSLQDYVDCNRRFQLRYIEHLQWPAVETAPVLENERRQIEGQQFHRMLHQYFLGLPIDKINAMAKNSNSQNLARWWDHFQTERFANQIVGTFHDERTTFPEQTLSAPLGGQRITAKYDLIAIKDGRATIYDWKTYHKRPRDEWMAIRLQTRVYLSLLIAAGAHLNGGQPFAPENVEMVYWYAEFPSEPSRFPYDKQHHDQDWAGLSNLLREISAKQSFPLTEDEKKCGFCPFRSYCERGIRAEAGEESETGADSDWELNLEQIQEIEF